jgi:hypothetical protein
MGLCNHIEYFSIDDSFLGCTIAKDKMELSVCMFVCGYECLCVCVCVCVCVMVVA